MERDADENRGRDNKGVKRMGELDMTEQTYHMYQYSMVRQ